MNIQVILVPYDSGHKAERTGRGPCRFLERGVDRMLRGLGHEVGVSTVESSAAFNTEVGTAFELNRLLAERVRSAVEGGSFPVVISGNCNSCVGTIAGAGSDRLGIIWFDAHGDFNTPETTLSGFLDGMGLAMAAGRCWRAILGTIPGYSPIPETNIVHVGARDLDAAERPMFEQAGIPLVTPDGADWSAFREAVIAALVGLRNYADRVYLHVDMDVLDIGQVKANHLAKPGGLPVEVVQEIIRMSRELFKVCAFGVSSFDPDYDRDDEALQAGFRLLEAMASESKR